MRIKQVVGPEPRRDSEYPDQFWVGYGEPKVHSIEQVHENCGTYGIEWFVAYTEDGSIIGKMNAAHTAAVFYFQEEKT